ncbi:MAG: hypothetical protein ACI8RZ_004894 [Myxococcota bacterium]
MSQPEALALHSGGSLGLIARRYGALGGDVVSWARASPLSLGRISEVTAQLSPSGIGAVRIRTTSSLDQRGAPLRLPAPIAGDSATLVLLALALRSLTPEHSAPMQGVLTGSGRVTLDGVEAVTGWPEKLSALAGAIQALSLAGPVTLLCPGVQRDEVVSVLKSLPAFSAEGSGWLCGGVRVLLVPIDTPSMLLRTQRRSRGLLIGGLSASVLGLLGAVLLHDGAEPRSSAELSVLWTGEQTGAFLHQVSSVPAVLEADTPALALLHPSAEKGRGRVELYTGLEATPAVTLIGSRDRNLTHANAVAIPDMDRDGFQELVVAIPESDRPGRNSGELLLLFGGPTMLSGSLSMQTAEVWAGPAEIARLGAAITPLDGLIAAGAPGMDRVYVFDPTDPVPVAVIGGRGERGIGRALAAGDVLGGDGIADLIVGAPTARSHDGEKTGAVLLYQGPLVGDLDARSPLDLDSAVSMETYGLHPGSQAGKRVWGLGDVDGDGLDDFAGLTPGSNRWGTDAGAIHVYLGRPVVVDAWTHGDWGHMAILGHDAQKLREAQVTSADLDGDGALDVVVGLSRGGSGSTLVWYGPLLPGTVLPEEADVVVSHGAEHGISRLAAVDVDGDGRDEVLLGMPGWGQAKRREVGAIWVLSE